MKNYIIMFCVYDLNLYSGHKIKQIEANSFEEAEKLGHKYLDGMTGKGKWEYIIAENPSSYRIYDNEKHKRL